MLYTFCNVTSGTVQPGPSLLSHPSVQKMPQVISLVKTCLESTAYCHSDWLVLELVAMRLMQGKTLPTCPSSFPPTAESH